MKAKSYMNLSFALGFLLLPLSGIAGESGSGSGSYLSNPLFNTLLIVIILLLIVNVVLSQALKNISQSDYITNKFKENKVNATGAKTLSMFVLFLLLTYSADAQNAGIGKNWEIGGIDPWTFYFMMGVIVLELIVMTVLLRLIHSFLKEYIKAEPVKVVEESVLLQKLTGAVAVEKENEIMLEHDYDGIRELDNDLPPWWKYGFYLTIIVSVVYLIHYHVVHTGDLQIAEYTKEVEKGKMEVAEFMKNTANNVDESNVKMLEGSDLESGKQAFIATCAACHGKFGEGGVGPNLTDAYWVHGGSLADIYKSIKYGWADKGMKAWKEDLSPVQIAQITSFIRSISGTNPANGKAPQGDLYKEEITIASDSLRTDSLKVNLTSDSSKVVASTK